MSFIFNLLVGAFLPLIIVVVAYRFLLNHYRRYEPSLNPYRIGSAFGLPLFLFGSSFAGFFIYYMILPTRSSYESGEFAMNLMTTDELSQRIWYKTLEDMGDPDFLYTYLLERDINGVLFLIIGFLTLYAIYGLFRRAIFSQKKLQNIMLIACAFVCIPNLLFGIYVAINDGGVGLLIVSLLMIAFYAYLLSFYNRRLSTIYQYGRQQHIPLPFTSSNQGTQQSSYVQTASYAPSPGAKPMKTCPYCGEEILAVAVKCKHCGEWLNKEPEAPKKMINCPICGEEVEEGLSTCPHCKEPIEQKEQVELFPCPICGEKIPVGSTVCPECKEPLN